ncbi:hypothetical protein ASF77_08480 [Massilia sp. Leaf139]|nr:hypothetical protein ASF77_08480 [Massilia sp. Leaf139]
MQLAPDVDCSGGQGWLPGGAAMEEMPTVKCSTLTRVLRRVLVVDDEHDRADLVEALLSNDGLEVRVAYGAAEALQILESDPDIDAVFSDIMMPGMTGLQLADAVGYLYPSIRVVLTSGYTSPALMASHGHTHLFVPKPYRIETVLKLLRD